MFLTQAGWTLLHVAGQQGHADVAELLIQKGALSNSENKVLISNDHNPMGCCSLLLCESGKLNNILGISKMDWCHLSVCQEHVCMWCISWVVDDKYLKIMCIVASIPLHCIMLYMPGNSYLSVVQSHTIRIINRPVHSDYVNYLLFYTVTKHHRHLLCEKVTFNCSTLIIIIIGTFINMWPIATTQSVHIARFQLIIILLCVI